LATDEFEEVSYEPTNVKHLLKIMKNISERIVDLAYAALIFNSRELAAEVEKLEYKMDKLLYQIRLSAMLAARTPKDAELLIGVLQVASAAECISNAAGDFVKLLDSKLEHRPFLPFVLREADEKIVPIEVAADSPMSGHTLRELEVETVTGARVIAVKRGKRWLYEVTGKTVVKPGDLMIVRGVEDGLEKLARFAKGTAAATDWKK
jgi:uncharacterized protein with PhoU and TrkA domain